MQTALDSKVDKISGKQLSENDFTSVLLQKLNGIQQEAEVNVQANWTQTSDLDDSFIQNKPTDVTDLSLHSVIELNDITAVGSGSIITDTERNQLQGLIPNASDDVAAIGDLITGKAITFQGPVSEEPIYDNAIYVETENTVPSLRFKNHGHVVKMDDIVQNLSTGIISGGAINITSMLKNERKLK